MERTLALGQWKESTDFAKKYCKLNDSTNGRLVSMKNHGIFENLCWKYMKLCQITFDEKLITDSIFNQSLYKKLTETRD